MNSSTHLNLKQLYFPLQPTIKSSAKDVNYSEILPMEGLQNYIYCYWELKTQKILNEPFNYRVVADGCIDIFFELKKPNENFVMGFCKKYTEFPLENDFHYIGVRFLPTMFPQLFDINAKLISNKFELLSNILPKTAQFITCHFGDGQNLEEVKNIFDRYFSEIIINKDLSFDKRLYDALNYILKNFGLVTIESDLDFGLSSRQLRRLFEYYLGTTAKVFGKVVRFQSILKSKPSCRSLKENKLFYDFGYFDQSHFIKEFKNFYGVTPTKAFDR